jgi:hypothetical protein
MVGAHIGVYHSIFIFFAHGVFVVLFEKDLAFPFKFFEIGEERGIYLLDAVDDDGHEDVIRIGPLLNEKVDVVGNTFKGSFQHGLVFGVHADADGHLCTCGFFEKREVVVLMVSSEFFEGGLGVDLLEGMKCIFVGCEAFLFVCVEHALG